MKNIAFFLLFFLLVSGHSNANAVGGSIGGWNVVSNVASGIGAKITATKEVMLNGASKVVTGTANITPKFTDVGRFMGRVGAAAVVTEAVNQVLNGVDYVMDPANNTVTYKRKTIDSPPCYDASCLPPSAIQGYQFSGGPFSMEIVTSLSAACTKFDKYWGGGAWWGSTTAQQSPPACISSNGSAMQTFGIIVNPNYDTSAEDETKPITVPLSDVASQVLDQAEKDIKAGNVASPAVALSRAVAQDMVAEAESDDVKARPIANQLEQTQAIPTDEDATGTIDSPEVVDPVTGEVVKPAESSSIAMKFPKACDWFPQLCLFIDWMQKPQELDEPDLPTKEIEKKEIDEELIKISSSSCPAPIDVNIPLPVFNTTYTDSISVSEYCPKIEKLAPVLQLLAFVLAIMIIKDI